MADADLDCDVLVIGGGMAGLAAACRAAGQGLVVGVVEKAPSVGGSALLSAGMLWCATDADDFLVLDPGADPGLVHLLVEQFPAASEWVATLGVPGSADVVMDAIHGFRSAGRQIDVPAFLRRAESVVDDAGGWVVRNARTEALLTDGGRLVGARVAQDGRTVAVRAASTILATGGFGGSPDLRRDLIGPDAEGLLVRANPFSVGDGLRLATVVGAALTDHTPGFYGHLVPAPLPGGLPPADFERLTHRYSPHALLLDSDGRRLLDESVGYEINASTVARQPGARALLVGDDVIAQQARSGPAIFEQFDRLEEAARAGANVAVAPTLGALAAAAQAWGYRDVDGAVTRFNRHVEGTDSTLVPPRQRNRRPLRDPPFFALEVQPGMTFTFRGLRIDRNARVLGEKGQVVPGLLCAGADAGGLYASSYAGGLSAALVLGVRAADTAVLAANAEGAATRRQ